ncbi:hypothetical protein HIM_09891 [Hirsutella minnesotensis 3608]|uniref:Uncharacterized protein n=1 Tax=Hirsutella minnesotensis 3608 TaxID=1043627 RepID=A0A0F7ZXH0_9HYPO|nr:hypothetical protein HIM_09891 [Hirsutella minnesotensis 3608]
MILGSRPIPSLYDGKGSGSEPRGALLDCGSLAALLLRATEVRELLAPVGIAGSITADDFSGFTIEDMNRHLSRLLSKVGDPKQNGPSSLIWLGSQADLEGQGVAILPIPEALVLEKAMLDRIHASLATHDLNNPQSGRRPCQHSAEHFSVFPITEDYPDADRKFFDMDKFSRSQRESLALWLSLNTLSILARAIGSTDCEGWTRDVLCKVDGRLKDGVLGRPCLERQF